MTGRVRLAIAAGAAYAALFVGVTALWPAPGSPETRILLGHLWIFLPTLAALLATLRAARGSLGAERAF